MRWRKRETRDPRTITVVSGLPRSGTSLMMRMLEAGGLEAVQDGERVADTDNPGGYYELERVKALDRGDTAWLDGAEGKAVKIVSALLMHLPTDRPYDVVFMSRRLAEVQDSQKRMLDHRDEADAAVDDDALRAFYHRHLAEVGAWMDDTPMIRALYVDYGSLVARPEAGARRLRQFLRQPMNVVDMAGVVDATLHRNREQTAVRSSLR